MQRFRHYIPLAMSVLMVLPMLHGCVVERVLNIDVKQYGPDMFAAAIALVLLIVAVLALLVINKRLRDKFMAELANRDLQLQSQDDRISELTAQVQDMAHERLSFLTNVSSDILHPLQLVDATVEDLAGESTGLAYQMLERAHRNIHMLLRLTGGILNMRTHSEKEIELHHVDVDMREAVHRWSQTFRREAQSKLLRFKVTIEQAQNYFANLDVEKIECVYFNMLATAFECAPDNSSVDIVMSRDFNRLVISVSFMSRFKDALATQQWLSRLSASESIPSHNMGIGLVLSRLLVELHGGQLDISAKKDGHVALRLSIPVGDPTTLF